MLTKERGGGRENRKEETEWLMALAAYRYNVQAIRRWSINSQRHEDERSEKARREVMWVIWVTCAISIHTLYGPWIHDEDHQLSFCDHHTGNQSLQTEERGSVAITRYSKSTDQKRVSPWEQSGTAGLTEWTGTKRTWRVYGVDQWVYRTHNDCLSRSGVGSHENRPLVIIRATMKKLMGLRPNTHFHYVALLSVLDACLQNLIWNIILL
jgi:hypothetical protein